MGIFLKVVATTSHPLAGQGPSKSSAKGYVLCAVHVPGLCVGCRIYLISSPGF